MASITESLIDIQICVACNQAEQNILPMQLLCHY